MIKKGSERKPRAKKNSENLSSETFKNFEKIPNLNNLPLHLKCKNETQKELIQSIKNNDVTVCTGPAGTGKSLCSIYTALKLIKENPKVYNSIILLKSITQLKDEILPALPGTAMEKMYFQNLSFVDSIIQLIGKEMMDLLVDTQIIKFDVIGSMRGRNLSSSIIILDECQNVTKNNLKTILTRLSENSKLIVLGDPKQLDIKNEKESSLDFITNKIKSNPIDGVNVVIFDNTHIVRHKLTNYFIELFEKN